MKLQNVQLATLAAIIIGTINVGSLGVVYVVFHKTHEPLQSETTQELAANTTSDIPYADQDNGTIVIDNDAPVDPGNQPGGSTNTPGQTGTGKNTPSKSGSSGSSGGSKPSSGGSGSSGSGGGSSSGSGGGSSPSSGGGSGSSGSGGSGSSGSGGSGSSTPDPDPASLAKGSPCKTQTPPAGVCQALLSFNTQKDGNPYWDPAIIAGIKKGVTDQVGTKGAIYDAIWTKNGLKLSLMENTWNGNSTKGTLKVSMGALGQTRNVIYSLKWTGSKWFVYQGAESN